LAWLKLSTAAQDRLSTGSNRKTYEELQKVCQNTSMKGRSWSMNTAKFLPLRSHINLEQEDETKITTGGFWFKARSCDWKNHLYGDVAML